MKNKRNVVVTLSWKTGGHQIDFFGEGLDHNRAWLDLSRNIAAYHQRSNRELIELALQAVVKSQE